MNFTTLVQRRYSVRDYRPEIPEEEVLRGIPAEDAAKLRQQLLLIEANAKECLSAERGDI